MRFLLPALVLEPLPGLEPGGDITFVAESGVASLLDFVESFSKSGFGQMFIGSTVGFGWSCTVGTVD